MNPADRTLRRDELGNAPARWTRRSVLVEQAIVFRGDEDLVNTATGHEAMTLNRNTAVGPPGFEVEMKTTRVLVALGLAQAR